MKVLFVNPPATTCLEITETGGRYVEENIGNRFFPLSKTPFEVMHKLNKNENIEKDILLLDYEWYKNPKLSKNELIDLVINKKPDVILTTLIAQASADTLDWVTTKIKDKLPSVKIIVGGQAIPHLQKKIFKFCPSIDFALIGNANSQLDALIKKFKLNDNNFRDINGLIYKKNGRIIKNSNTDNKLVTYGKEIYEPHNALLKEIINLVKKRNAEILCSEEFSKGCPFRCSFCAAKRKYQEKDISKVISLLAYLCSLKIYKFYLEDLTFGVNPNHRETVLKELKKLKGDYKEFGFRCVTRADMITKEFVKSLSEAGCYEIGIGIECNDGGIINSMNKNIPISKNVDSLKILGESDLSFKLFLIEGYPGSSSLTSKKTFRLLNYLEKKNYNYFIQPALNRDIIPSQKRFREKEKKEILKRGTMNQLDFRHDCRKQTWDSDRSIRSICLLMLAYPSTELGKENKDKALQKRILLDIPFLKDGITINDLTAFLNNLKSDSKNKTPLRTDLAHYIDGIYTKEEIKTRLRKIHNNLNKAKIDKELDYCFNELEGKGLIDSFRKPNLNRIRPCFKNKNNANPARQKNMLLFWNGGDKKYVYAPGNKEIIKIKSNLYKKLSKEIFEFLILLKGVLSLEEIEEKLFKLFKGEKGFENKEKSKETTKRIYWTCKNYGLCN